MALARLLDKQIIKLGGQFEKGFPGYHLTPLGRLVTKHVLSNMPIVKNPTKEVTTDESNKYPNL